MAVYDPEIQGQAGIDAATGHLFSFTDLMFEVVIQVRSFSDSTQLCYVQLNQIPAAASQADNRQGLQQGATLSLQGDITGVGFRMTSGTCVAEVVGYKFKGIREN